MSMSELLLPLDRAGMDSWNEKQIIKNNVNCSLRIDFRLGSNVINNHNRQ